MTDDKNTLLRQLDEIRDELWAILDDFDPAVEIYPGWKKREFYAHMGGWDGMIFETLRDYTDGKTPKRYVYKNADDANEDFVAMRKGLPLETAKLESEINRFAIKVFLNAIPEDQYQQIQFPWGMETLIDFLRGAITHEREHADDILKLKAV
jgi:hypothetical protein